MKEPKFKDGDMVYIDNTNNVYRLCSYDKVGDIIYKAVVYSKDSPTGYMVVEHPELVRHVPSQQVIDESKMLQLSVLEDFVHRNVYEVFHFYVYKLSC